MLQINDILFSLCVIFVLLMLTYGLGHIIQIVFSSARALNVFEKFFTGFLLLTSLGAIITTKGITVLFPVPFLVVLYVLKREPGVPIPIRKKEVLLFVLLSTLSVFFFYLFGLVSINGDYVKYVSGDFNIYIRIAEQINRLGVESNQLDSVYPPGKPSPYHYGDIWIFAMIAKLVSHNPSVIFIVSLALLYVIFVTGLYCYTDDKFQPQQANRKWLYLVISAGLFSGFSLFFPKFLLIADIYTKSILNYPKVLLPGCFIIWALIQVKRKDWLGLSIVSGLAVLNFINIAPAFCLAVFFIFAINMFLGGIRLKPGIGYLGLIILILGIPASVLYILIPRFFPADVIHEPVKNIFDVQAYIVRGVKIFFGGLLQVTTIIPFIVLSGAGFIFLRKKMDMRRIFTGNQDIAFLILLLISSLLCWSLFHPVVADAVQFYINILYVFYAITITLILMWLVMVIRHKVLIFLVLTGIIISLSNNYIYTFSVSSILKKDWDLISGYLKKENNKNLNFANVRPLNSFSSLFDKNTQGFIPLTIINYLDAGYNNISLNTPFIRIDESGLYAKEEKELIRNAPFNVYYNKYIASHPEYNPSDIIPAFLREYDIRYVSVHDTLIPEVLSGYVVDSISWGDGRQRIYTIDIKQI